MNSFKINRYDNLDSSDNYEQNGFSEFESLSLEYLNGQENYTKEEKAKTEEYEKSRDLKNQQNLAEVMDVFDRGEKLSELEFKQDVIKGDIHNKNHESGRFTFNYQGDKGLHIKNSDNAFYLEDYGANFDIGFSKDDRFIARKNRYETQGELNENLELAKSEERYVSSSQKIANIGKALIGKITA